MSPTVEETSGTYTATVTNVTDRPVAITEFKGGCGCIAHVLPVKSLAPGASTTLTLIFEFKDYVGPQKRKIALLTKREGDAEAVRNEIMLTGEIPTPLRFTKKAVIWLYGDEGKPKEIQVAVKDGFTLNDLRVEQPDATRFLAVTQSFDQAAKVLTITIAPTTTDLAVVSPTERANLQIPYIVRYTLPSGVQRYERFWAMLAKRPEAKAAPVPPPPAPANAVEDGAPPPSGEAQHQP